MYFSPILIFPVLSIIIVQTIKFFIKSNRQQFSLKNFFAYSGMPSGHSAMMISLLTITGLVEGINSPLFAISFILAIIVIRDALGIRRYLGQHGKTLNNIIGDLKDDNVLEHKYPHFIERIGHTPLEVMAGSLIGLTVSLVGYLFF